MNHIPNIELHEGGLEHRTHEEDLPTGFVVVERLFPSMMSKEYIAYCHMIETNQRAIAYFDGIYETPISIQTFLLEKNDDHAELDQDTPIEATTAPRKFPNDYCEACGRVTGTEIYTGACGGCFMKRMLDQDNK